MKTKIHTETKTFKIFSHNIVRKLWDTFILDIVGGYTDYYILVKVEF